MKKISCIAFLTIAIFVQKGFGQSYKFEYDHGGGYASLSSGTTLSTSYLNNSYSISLGFNFVYLGVTYNSVTVSSNGLIYFNGGAAGVNAIGATLQSKSGNGSVIRYQKGGSTGSHYLVIEWYNAGFYADKTTGSYTNFEISLQESYNVIGVSYGVSSTLYTSYFTNSSPVIFLYNSSGGIAYSVNSSYNMVSGSSALGSVPSAGDVFLFQYVPGKPKISVSSPLSSAVWYQGKTYTINWTSSDVSDLIVKISMDGGKTYMALTGSLDASTNQSTTYIVPSISKPDSNCIIKVENTSDTTTYDLAGPFIISNIPPDIKLKYPIGSEKFEVGTTVPISWSPSGVSKVNIYYSKNNGTWNLIGTSNAGDSTYTWTIPNDTSSFVKIKIASTIDNSINSVSADFFQIYLVNRSISFLTSDLLGTSYLPTLFSSDTFNIKWTSLNVSNINITYYTVATGLVSIAKNVSATSGRYVWTVPNMNASNVIITLQDADHTSLYTLSKNFAISNVKPVLTLTYPVGGEYLDEGSTANLTWNYSNVTNVYTIITLDNGANWYQIGTSAFPAAAGGITWTVPNQASNQCAIEIIDADNYVKIYDINKIDFTIGPHTSAVEADIKANKVFSIYPNPSQGEVNLKLNADFTGNLIITNSLGQVSSIRVIDSKQGENLDIPSENLSAGIYFVKLISRDNDVFSQKLLIQK